MDAEYIVPRIMFIAEQISKFVKGDVIDKDEAFMSIVSDYTDVLVDICDNPELKVDLALTAATNSAAFSNAIAETREKFQC